MRSIVSVASLVLTFLGAALPAAGQQGRVRDSIAIGRGTSVSASVVNGLTGRLMGNARCLFKNAVMNTTFSKKFGEGRTPKKLSTSSMGFDGSLALYTFSRDQLVGDAVFFLPDRDPVTGYRKRLEQQRLEQQRLEQQRLEQQRLGQRRLATGGSGAPVEKGSIWDDVGLKCYVQFEPLPGKKSGRSGPMVCWNDEGEKLYYCEYEKDKPEGVCCLFDQDKLQAVLECHGGQPQTVTLVSDWTAQKTLRREAALADSEGRAMLDKFASTEAALKKQIKDFVDAHHKYFQSAVAGVTVTKRGSMLANEKALEAEKAESMRQIQNTVKQAPAAQAYLWGPATNYSPVWSGSLYGPPE